MRASIIIAIITLIIGGIIGVITTRAYSSRYQLAYYLSEPALVVDSSQPVSSIQILDAQGKEVEGSVYTTKLTVWNSGTETIPYEEVLEPVEISNSNIKRILSNPKTDFVREDRANFDILPGDSKSFTLKWEKFDPRTAVEIQIVFEVSTDLSSNQLSDFDVNGELVKGKLVRGISRENRGLRDGFVLALLFLGLLIFFTISLHLSNYISEGVLKGAFKDSLNLKKPSNYMFYFYESILITVSLLLVYFTFAEPFRGVFGPSLIVPTF